MKRGLAAIKSRRLLKIQPLFGLNKPYELKKHKNSLLAFFQYARRISCNDCVGGDIFGDHATGADDGAFADGDAAEDGGIGADRGALLYDCRYHFPVGFCLQTAAVGCSLGVLVICEHDPVADEDFVLYGDALADEGVTLNFAVSADGGVFLDLDEGADLGAVADGAAVEIDEFVQLDVLSNDDVRSDFIH